MKKFLLLSTMFLGFIFTLGFSINASEVTEENKEVAELKDGGVGPDQFLYRFDKFFEKVSLRVTFSDEKRIEKLSSFAEERLAELNELDEEEAVKYADQLFNEHGLDLEKATLYVQTLVAEGKISEEKLARLSTKIEKVEAKQDKVKDYVSEEVVEKVRGSIEKAKMSIFSRFENLEEIKALHGEGYGYGQLLKLQALSSLSSKTLTELLAIENSVTIDENNEKTINFEVLLESTGFTQEELNSALKEIRNTAKEEMKSQAKNGNKKGPARDETNRNRNNENSNEDETSTDTEESL